MSTIFMHQNIIPAGQSTCPGAPYELEQSPLGQTNAALWTPVALITPPAWTAAPITFRGSLDGIQWFDIYDDLGNEIVIPSGMIPTNAPRRFALPIHQMLGIPRLMVRSGTGSAPVNQAAERVITITLRDLE